MPAAGRGCYPGPVAVNISQAVKQAMQDLIAPELESLRGDIKALRGELHAEIGGLRSELKGEIASLRGELTGLHGEVNGLRGELNGLRAETAANIARLDERLTIALDVRERLVALEARVAASRP